MIKCWEEYHDDATNFEYELPHFTLEGYNTEDDFYHKNNICVFGLIFNAIEFALLAELNCVPCFIMDGAIMTIDKKLFSEKLDECLAFYEKNELYENCAQIVKLKALL